MGGRLLRRRQQGGGRAGCGLAVSLRLRDGTAVNVQGPNGSELLQDSPSREEIDAAIERVS
ncbi:MAG: hypothetical protein U0R24_05120 [Solirubrobacterales bacterium]